jgi:hypothetical protein
MSMFDILTLVACYLCAAAYLTVSLRHLRAVKSRLGLVVTVLTQVGYQSFAFYVNTKDVQIATSILSTFTVLAVLKVPVSHVPR